MAPYFVGALLLAVLLGLLIWWTQTGRFVLWLGAIVGFLALNVVVLALLCVLIGAPGCIVWVGGLIILLTLWVQIRRARQRSLLKLVTLAVEKGMPLPAVVRAMAADQSAGWRWKLSDLADRLGRGSPLSAAALIERGALSPDAIVAAQMGEATGDLAGALKQIEASDDVRTPAQHTLVGNAFYLAWPVLFLPLVGSFLVVAILPQLIRIFDDFGIELPAVTVLFVKVVMSPLGIFAAVVVAIAVAVAAVYVVLCYAGIVPLPGVGLGRRFERSRLLRGLALAVGARQPLSVTLAALARSYPNPSISRRLEACGQEVAGGGNWIASLTKHRLIGQRDAAVAESAQRVGNLPWALGELADSNERRLIYQLEAALNIASPLILLLWGGVIFFFAVAFFLPLVKLISSLSMS